MLKEPIKFTLNKVQWAKWEWSFVMTLPLALKTVNQYYEAVLSYNPEHHRKQISIIESRLEDKRRLLKDEDSKLIDSARTTIKEEITNIELQLNDATLEMERAIEENVDFIFDAETNQIKYKEVKNWEVTEISFLVDWEVVIELEDRLSEMAHWKINLNKTKPLG